jgi:L-lactate transport
MWTQNYFPIAGSLPLSTAAAAVPILTMLVLLGVLRKPAWVSALTGLLAAVLMAAFAYGMPWRNLIGAATEGAAFGLFPIGWIVFAAILLYRVTLESGKFEIIKDSVGHLTDDRRLQVLLIAFAFSAFIEGGAGFGTPVAVAATMLVGLGFAPFYAAALCLLANTAPVAFGSIGIPIITLAGTTGLPLDRLSAGVGRMCSPVALFLPAYIILIMGGWKALKGVLPAVAVCGAAFGGFQFLISNYVGPQLTAIGAAIAAMLFLVILLKFWKPHDSHSLAEEHATPATVSQSHYSGRVLLQAWSPYILLVVFVLAWSLPGTPLPRLLNLVTVPIRWPWLHNEIQRVPPVVTAASPYAAVFNLNWLSAAGTSCFFAALFAAPAVGMNWKQFLTAFRNTCKQLVLAELTLAAVLALAYVMNYSGATGTLGLAFAATGAVFPFFSALLGWMGVFLTGSDTSANALFGSLQEVTANRLGMNAALMASANSAGGVMGKMISLTSVAVASAATGMKRHDEARLFRFTVRHSVLLAVVMGLLAVFYAYVAPQFAP